MTTDAASSVGFVVKFEGDEPTANQLIRALAERLLDVATGEDNPFEALWDMFDPFETEKEATEDRPINVDLLRQALA